MRYQDPNDNSGGYTGTWQTGGTDTTPPTVSNPEPGVRYVSITGNGWWEFIAGMWYFTESTARTTVIP